MSSDSEDFLYDDDESGNEDDSGNDSADEIEMDLEGLTGGDDDEFGHSSSRGVGGVGGEGGKAGDDDFTYEVLTTEQIVNHMVDSIKEVNNVIQVAKN